MVPLLEGAEMSFIGFSVIGLFLFIVISMIILNY